MHKRRVGSVLMLAFCGLLTVFCAVGPPSSPDTTPTWPGSTEAGSPPATHEETPVLTPSSPPGPTPLPPNTYMLHAVPWPESGDLVSDFEGEVTFGETPGRLPQGEYIILGDEWEHTIRYASLRTSASGVLLRLGGGIGLPWLFADPSSRLMLGEAGQTSRLYDLELVRAWQIGPLCVWRSIVHPSPDGKWIALECDYTRIESVAEPHTVVEVISTEHGTGVHIALPLKPNGETDRLPLVNWLDSDRLIVTDAWVEGTFRTCSLTVPGGIIYCPQGLEAEKGPYPFGIRTSAGGLVALTYLEEHPSRSALVPKECFTVGGSCDSPIDLSQPGTVPVMSPDPALIWWITPLGLERTFRVGVYDAPTWASRTLAELSGDYRMQALCPDGRCMFVERLDSTLRYRLDLDGTLTVVPYQEIIGTFSIP